MKSQLVSCLTVISAWTLPVTKRSNSGAVEVSLQKGKTSKRHDSTFRKLQASIPDSTLNFTGIEYFMDYKIGDQWMKGILDTGSSDTWVFSTAAGANEFTFDPQKASNSSSYKWFSNGFSAAYGDGSNTVSGSWASDTVTVGGASVENYPFAFSNVSSTTYFPDNIAIFGISVEEAVTRTPKYKPFTQRLYEQGTIDSYSYTIYTTNEGETGATLILGGIDTAKLDSPLCRLPRSFDGSDLHGLSSDYLAVDTSTDNGDTFQAIWDTGTSLLLLPESVADDIAGTYGFEWDFESQAYISQNGDVTGKPPFNLTFSNFTVQIPPEDMIAEEEDGIYLFAVGRGESELFENIYILGDPILRQLSFTFDVENNEYAIAKVKHTSDSNVVPINSSIPDAQDPPGGYTSVTATTAGPIFTLPSISWPTSFAWPTSFSFDLPTATSSSSSICTKPAITGTGNYFSALAAAQSVGGSLSELNNSNKNAQKIYAQGESAMKYNTKHD